MKLGIPKQIIAFSCLLIFIFAIYGTAFGTVGCHSSGDGFQSLECYQAHPPVDIPHLDASAKSLCACDPLACHVLKSRNRVKRQLPELAEFLQSSVYERVPSPSAMFAIRNDGSPLLLASQSLVFLRTVVLLH